jgi:uncharacterized protein with PIN domain
MILDTSALAAIFFGEPEADLHIRVTHDIGTCRIDAAKERISVRRMFSRP